MAVSAQGVSLVWSTGTAAITTASKSSHTVAEVFSFSGPGGSPSIIDVTHFQSTMKEKLPGLADEGQLNLECNLGYSTDVTQKALVTDRAARTKRKAGINFSDTASSICQFDAYCTGFSISGAVDNKLTASIVLEITGACAWST